MRVVLNARRCSGATWLRSYVIYIAKQEARKSKRELDLNLDQDEGVASGSHLCPESLSGEQLCSGCRIRCCEEIVAYRPGVGLGRGRGVR